MVHLILVLPVLLGYLSTLTTATLASTQCTPPEKNTTYPDKCHITKVFNYLSTGNDTAFFTQVAPDVHWTLMGTHPLAGQYHNRTVFITDSLERLDSTLDPAYPTTLTLTHIVGGGDEEWSVQELHGLGVCKNGNNFLQKYSPLERVELADV
jgi:ketosteroid isomerase-like protein